MSRSFKMLSKTKQEQIVQKATQIISRMSIVKETDSLVKLDSALTTLSIAGTMTDDLKADRLIRMASKLAGLAKK